MTLRMCLQVRLQRRRGTVVPCTTLFRAKEARGGRGSGAGRRSWCADYGNLPSHTRGGSRMRESRTYGSVRGACDETHVPTATCASRKLVRSSRWKSGPSKGQRPLGSECCVHTGDSGHEAYTAIEWGGGLSHERSDIAGTERLHSLEGNMCDTAMRGANTLPGSK